MFEDEASQGSWYDIVLRFWSTFVILFQPILQIWSVALSAHLTRSGKLDGHRRKIERPGAHTLQARMRKS